MHCRRTVIGNAADRQIENKSIASATLPFLMYFTSSINIDETGRFSWFICSKFDNGRIIRGK